MPDGKYRFFDWNSGDFSKSVLHIFIVLSYVTVATGGALPGKMYREVIGRECDGFSSHYVSVPCNERLPVAGVIDILDQSRASCPYHVVLIGDAGRSPY